MDSIALRVLAGWVLLSCLGCGNPSAPPTTAAPPAAETTAQTAPPDGGALPSSAVRDAEQGPSSLAVKSWDEVQQWIADQRGKVVVVDLWSSWCVPCVREFPKLVKLAQDYSGDVVCLGFNLDYSGAVGETPESFLDSIGQFLTKQGAAFPNAISSEPDEDIFQRLQLGSIPAVLIYDREGRLSKRFDNDDNLYGDEGFSYDDHIAPWIEQLRRRDSDSVSGQ